MFYRKKGSKYNATKATVNGEVFDSKREARRFLELTAMAKSGEIYNLQRQIKFLLIPAQREPDIVGPKGGRKPGKLVEREVSYIADFMYSDRDGNLVVEDVKGMRTKEYVLKRKMLLHFYGIRIKEV